MKRASGKVTWLLAALVVASALAVPAAAAGGEPALPEDGLQLWLRADRGVQVEDGIVVRWEDQSPQQNHAAADVSHGPALVENALNGYPVLRFDGEDDYMRVPHADGLNAVDGFTTFVVFSYEDPGLRIAQKKDNTAGNEADAWYINPRGGLAVAGVRHRQRPFETGVYHLQASVLSLSDGELRIYKNGEHVVTELQAQAQVPNEDDLLIGKREHSNGQNLVGDIAEFIIYNRTLSDDELDAVTRYLLDKYFPPTRAAGPRVVLLGDSIRRGYQGMVVEVLGSRADVWYPEENNRYTAHLLESLAAWMKDLQPDVVHVNAGLHDLWMDGAQNRVPLDEYRRNLEQIIATIREHTDATIIWATTTPVIDSRVLASSGRQGYKNSDVERYNAVAREVMEEHGVVINDLYGLVTRLGVDRLIAEDGVHFTQAGYMILGTAVAESIAAVLE